MSFLNHLIDMLHQHAQGQGPGVNPTGPVMHGDVRQQVAINHAAGGFPGGGAMETLGDVTVRPQDAQFLQARQHRGFGFGYPQPQQNLQQFQVRPPVNGLQQPNPWEDETAGGAMQGYNQNDLSEGIQGGVVNQGYIPLQSSLPRSRRR